MKLAIKEYWENLKVEYEATYNASIFSDYDVLKQYAERFRTYLITLMCEYSNDVDVACTLATVEQVLRDEKNSIELLEGFLEAYTNELSDTDKARIYTNLAFYHNGEIEEYNYLVKAEKLNSPYIETYRGLALYHFSSYENSSSVEALTKSLHTFEKGLTVANDYEMNFGRAVCLFDLKEYDKAKTNFEELLKDYPNRMRLLLCIAYCDVYLGNKKQALNRLKQIKTGVDSAYHLDNDDISEFDIIDAYYILDEYGLFLEECEKAKEHCDLSDGPYYFGLWIMNQHNRFYHEVNKQRTEILACIEDAKMDEDFDSEEKQDYIKSWEDDLKNLNLLEHKIKDENYKPVVELKLWPIYGCYLIDCLTHNF
ncbi:tetratricopeptide repeat protein [Veillonella parvula]|uniref:tetratricopeptide repeat protein n=1 Tax=Veillonella parvula TaxID=29466 RepID=UPI0028E854F2|nr:tetratricopeptide repeat protein [Veillonella parvula]